MFWYSDQIRRELIELPLKFSNTKQDFLIKHLKKETGVDFKFDKKYHSFLIDRELHFMNAIFDVAPKSMNIEKRINKILGDGLRFDERKVYNETGSFGCTYLVIQEGKTFVLKVPKSSNDTFNREFNVMNGLYSSGGLTYLPFVTSFNKEDGSYLEEVAIDSLDHYIKVSNNISVEEKIDIVTDIIHAVNFIHTHGIVHRDLHPGNVFKFENNNTEKWKLADFGLAFDTNNDVSCGERHPGCYGDMDFISPEQLNNFDIVSFQNDIYSVGRLINFIFTKRAKNSNHMLKEISEKCCTRHIKDRYPSSATLLSDFLNISNNLR